MTGWPLHPHSLVSGPHEGVGGIPSRHSRCLGPGDVSAEGGEVERYHQLRTAMRDNQEVATHAPELGATLRTWRDRMSPQAAGLPSAHARRAAGLRREELAELTGISVDYVVRLEQGRSSAPSAQVAAALARALQLTHAERDHLFRLAGLLPPTDGDISDHIPPGVHRVLNRLGDAAVAVFAPDWQLIWWNKGWAALLGDPSSIPRPYRNFALDTFPVADHAPRLAQWAVTSTASDAVETAVVSDLRDATAHYPHDNRLISLIYTLTTGNQRLPSSGPQALSAHTAKTTKSCPTRTSDQSPSTATSSPISTRT